ncbi:hypothetical protein BKH42_02465 [Helicobacter sp. 13S00482-2]|nr:hypothetical protein BKH42_02465 [Helicobacter sp. 13S00482-2]
MSESFLDFDTNSSSYLAGIKPNDPDGIFPLTNWKEGYKNFSEDEFKAIQYGIGAGYFIANLKAIRKDGIEEKWINYASLNSHKLILPEQDVLNIICYPYIDTLSLKHMVAHYAWKRFGENWEKLTPVIYSKKELDEANSYPIQIHYEGNKKPWVYVDEPKSELWFYYLAQTPFLKEYLAELPKTIIATHQKTLFSYRIKTYIKKNPSFFINPRFYLKIFDRLKYKLLKILNISQQ